MNPTKPSFGNLFVTILLLTTMPLVHAQNTRPMSSRSTASDSAGKRTSTVTNQSKTNASYKLSSQRIEKIKSCIDNYSKYDLSEPKVIQKINAEIAKIVPLIPNAPLKKDDSDIIRKDAQNRIEEELGTLSSMQRKIEEDAKEKYPLYKTGDQITLNYNAGTKRYSVKGMLVRITQKSVTVDEKKVNIIDLPEEELAKFDAKKNQDFRSRYVRNRVSSEQHKRIDKENEYVMRLHSDYIRQNEQAGYIFIPQKAAWFTAQEVTDQYLGSMMAINQLTIKAQNGDPEAQFELAENYYNGTHEKKDIQEALKWYKKVAERGNVKAQLIIANILYNGTNIDKNYTEAFQWYQKAAKQGNVDAEYMLGECFSMGRGVKQDYQEAMTWYEKAANHCRADAEKGDAVAQYRQGRLYNAMDDYFSSRAGADRAFLNQLRKERNKWYLLAAEQGIADAQYWIGLYLCNEDKRDFFSLGVMGEYFEESEGMKWIRKSAEQGNVSAQSLLGHNLYSGYHVRTDKNEAFKWIYKAAQQGDERSYYELGQCFRLGQGTEKNVKEAVKWYKKAADYGDERAKSILKEIGF